MHWSKCVFCSTIIQGRTNLKHYILNNTRWIINNVVFILHCFIVSNSQGTRGKKRKETVAIIVVEHSCQWCLWMQVMANQIVQLLIIEGVNHGRSMIFFLFSSPFFIYSYPHILYKVLQNIQIIYSISIYIRA